MTRPPRTLRAVLKYRPAHGAMDFAWHPFLYEVYLDADYGCASAPYGRTLSFLARVRLWLQLLWGNGPSIFETGSVRYNASPNRRRVRRSRSKSAARRQACPLGYHIYRRKGLKACQQWHYNRGLIGRVAWCFAWRKRRHKRRRRFAGRSLVAMLCAAPLRPD